MNLRNLVVALLLFGAMSGQAQLDPTARIYTLISGSELTDDCPICDRVPIVVPMTGTFRLKFLDQTSIATHFAVQAIAFHAGTNGGAEYWVRGGGTYQVGGEVAVTQDLFLDVQVYDVVTNTRALCVNVDRSVRLPWPQIQAIAGQTNGTPEKVYSLKVVAEPALQFRSLIPDPRTGNISLEWAFGGQVQVERAGLVGGQYSPISPIITNQTFTDIGAMTNQAVFYRLRQF
jgi:hypothetical protein